MRTNLPITQQEFHFPPDATLLSTTDTSSHITYANEAFIEVSGYDTDEILGQPHNLVRHPDMPSQAFADMWETLKAGLSWTALIKNRRKDGDHYWVRANATPVIHDGQTVGYMSVRTSPGREEVEAAESLYRDFRENKVGLRRFRKGLVVRTGILGWMSLLQTLSVRWRIGASTLASLALVVLAAWLAGLQGPMLGAFCGAAAVISLLATLWLDAQISRPLQAVLNQAQAVAAGQPGENRHLNRVDEIGMILRAINQSGLNLRSLVDDVSGQLGGLRRASSDIAAGNQHLNDRSLQSAASLEETAASMEQMTVTVKNNADTAIQASRLAASASQAASDGNAVARDVIATMSEITEASRKIREIITLIEGISFQTNILSLNAAVEAARAGEHGRGFAVVAGEVRTLAQRSSSAAREITALINDSVAKTASGGELVGKAGDAMRNILGQVTRVADLIGEISSATNEQFSGISQVNVAVTQLDQMTQQNANLVQQSADAADDLQIRTGRLVEAVKIFQAGAAGGGR
ncbi:MAG: PAS domain-containing protein [Paraburkholderia sp.]|uniref:methyl-accepting chemotaxis protein n=1 Tax=Paraburkholderia sp. TaxID=1926495 RepID=UPI00120C3872|nr:methyl-accepting chemotaxis protein [Paraburkholderia sp.]TAM01134.1 MAG: PAS domain-containing protein [Paraburkholderia sp.]TAM30395.1 MAG: PAS domain-containing protein [Paraburkholderia sp.]